jgi:hypothetical protein
MDPVSNVGHLLEALRKQLAESPRKAGTGAKAGAPASAAAAAGRPDVAQLQKKIREKLQRIDSGDPQSRRKSVHVFLESVLLWEFGEQMMDDPKFYALLDEVQSSMESDPALRESLTTLVSQLR